MSFVMCHNDERAIAIMQEMPDWVTPDEACLVYYAKHKRSILSRWPLKLHLERLAGHGFVDRQRVRPSWAGSIKTRYKLKEDAL